MIQRQTQTTEFWSEQFALTTEDLEYLNNLFLESETPLTIQALTFEVIKLYTTREENAIQRRLRAGGDLYRPEGLYEVGQHLVFPALDYISGEVTAAREGYNPDQGNFQVFSVLFENGRQREFAGGLGEHPLNYADTTILADGEEPVKSPEDIQEKFGDRIAAQLERDLKESGEFVKLAGRWFPSGLLIELNIGHMNLAEAVLDMHGGGPLPTEAIIGDLDLPTNGNPNLRLFSLAFALQRDNRFDEVGPAGRIMWYLKRYEPAEVLETPPALRYVPPDHTPTVELSAELRKLAMEIDDEWREDNGQADESRDEVTVTLIAPHVQSGTLPLTARLQHLFPTAYAAPRVRFDLIDHHTGEKVPGWVVRSGRYVYGLREWYQKYKVQAGSYLTIRKGNNPGEAIINITRQRPKRDWLRTVNIIDGQVHFTMSKQPMYTTFEDETVIVIPDDTDLTDVNQNYARRPLSGLVRQTFSELAKLSQQTRVHAKSLYAAVNVTRRCPPELVFAELLVQPYFSHVGDAYWHLDLG